MMLITMRPYSVPTQGLIGGVKVFDIHPRNPEVSSSDGGTVPIVSLEVVPTCAREEGYLGISSSSST